MKKTIKRQIAEFVANKGVATRTEIIEFYIDLTKGDGHYQSNRTKPVVACYDKQGVVYYHPYPKKSNFQFRGRLSAGFNDNYNQQAWLMNKNTSEYLVRVSRGKYSAVIH